MTALKMVKFAKPVRLGSGADFDALDMAVKMHSAVVERMEDHPESRAISLFTTNRCKLGIGRFVVPYENITLLQPVATPVASKK